MRSVHKCWQPPEGLSPDDVKAVIIGTTGKRDRSLLRGLRAGARVSEVLGLRPLVVQRDHLVLPNRRNPNVPGKRVYLPAGHSDLPGALLVRANGQGLGSRSPICFSRKRCADGGSRAISRVQAWTILEQLLSKLMYVCSRCGRHTSAPPASQQPLTRTCFAMRACANNVRITRSLPLDQQAGGSRLQMAYLSVVDEQARLLMQEVP